MKDLEINGGRGLVVDEGRVGDWMQTWSGRRFYPADPRPEDVDIVDIAFALSNLSRYAGHCRFYSVAEHSVLVSKLVPERDAPAGLFHDAPEIYGASDIIRPVKRIVGRENAILQLEKGIYEKAIAPAFGLPKELPRSVLETDVAICAVEKRALHPRSDPWDLPFTPPDVKINAHDPMAACLGFITRYAEIYGVPVGPIRERVLALLEQDARAYLDQFRLIGAKAAA